MNPVAMDSQRCLSLGERILGILATVMMSEAAGLVLFLVLLLIRLWSDNQQPPVVEMRQMQQRIQELLRQTTQTVDGRLLVMDRDMVRTWKEGGDPDYGSTYLLYEYVPYGASERIEARHYITGEKAAEPGLAMRVGGCVQVRYSVGDPSLSMLDDL